MIINLHTKLPLSYSYGFCNPRAKVLNFLSKEQIHPTKPFPGYGVPKDPKSCQLGSGGKVNCCCCVVKCLAP